MDSQKVEELIDDELNYAVSCKEIDEMVRMLADIISKAGKPPFRKKNPTGLLSPVMFTINQYRLVKQFACLTTF